MANLFSASGTNDAICKHKLKIESIIELGFLYDIRAKFCCNCGLQLTARTIKVYSEKKSKRPKKIVVIPKENKIKKAPDKVTGQNLDSDEYEEFF